jgi:pyruvate kinase
LCFNEAQPPISVPRVLQGENMLNTPISGRARKLTPTSRVAPVTLAPPVDALLELREEVAREGLRTFESWRPRLARTMFEPAALNMAYYLALRKRDLRPFQEALTPWGLSSLGRSEAHVLASLDAVLVSIARLTGRADLELPPRPRAASFALGERLLARNTRRLFGPPPEERHTHIMVTLPERAATDAAFVETLVARGMSCARLNCAHGTHDEWAAMVRHVRAAETKLGRTCRVLMDLGGPRVRTGAVLARQERRLLTGDSLLLRPSPPDPALLDHPFQVQCLPGEIFDRLGPGTLLSIDEGTVRARVESVGEAGAIARVTQAPPEGARLKPDKGLNFPGTELGIPSLTDKDRRDLDALIANADLIGYSFVQHESDIDTLWHEIEQRMERASRPAPGLILKIETEQAVRNLPALIVTAAGRTPTGVMIARGDLAVEVGFQRLAELQEEILWLTEAADTPVIWATQVLDNFVRKGRPSRAEMSDVVLAARAECVMLNKGDFLPEALPIVDDIFRRMQGHQHKKTARLRALRAWT